MPIRNVTHSCGHTQRHDLSGNSKQADDRAAHVANGLCRECWIAEAREKEATEAATFAAANALPALVGSEKQVAWAEKIRAEKLAGLRERFPQMGGDPLGAKVLAAIEAKADARYWIDARSLTAREIVRAAAAEVPDADAKIREAEARNAEAARIAEAEKAEKAARIAEEREAERAARAKADADAKAAFEAVAGSEVAEIAARGEAFSGALASGAAFAGFYADGDAFLLQVAGVDAQGGEARRRIEAAALAARKVAA